MPICIDIDSINAETRNFDKFEWTSLDVDINLNGSVIYFYYLWVLVKPVIAKAKALRLCKEDFEVLKVIGKGAFGEVAVVRMREVGEVNWISYIR